MKSASPFVLVFVTVPNLKTARKLARLALQTRLVACANLVPKVESHYWWHERLERSAEVLIIFKTHRKHLAALELLTLKNHPYDTPEFLTLSLSQGTRRYLQWLEGSCG